MELVEHHHGGPLEERVARQLAPQNPLGEEPEPGLRSAALLEAHAVADLSAGATAALGGDVLGRGPRRDAARLEHDNLPAPRRGRRREAPPARASSCPRPEARAGPDAARSSGARRSRGGADRSEGESQPAPCTRYPGFAREVSPGPRLCPACAFAGLETSRFRHRRGEGAGTGTAEAKAKAKAEAKRGEASRTHYCAPYAWIGGRRLDQGRAFSSCAAMRMSRSSRPYGATRWAPIGKPAELQ